VTLVTLARILALFGSLSLVSLGGRNSVLPEMQRAAVEEYGWMSDRQFADLFAISEAAPGPSSLMVALIGLKAGGVSGLGGLLGALAAVVAMVGPACALTWIATRGWERLRRSRWRAAAESGLAPITVGLVAASVLTIARSADHDLVAWAVTVATAALVLNTRINPLFLMLAGALLGVLGLI
jgi:chromate transporter